METKIIYLPPQTEEVLVVVEGIVCGSPTGTGENRDPWES